MEPSGLSPATPATMENPMTARFLIEVPHEATTLSCVRAVQSLLKSGSHFLTHADWGCKDGEHKAWIIVEVGSKEEARAIVPPEFRSQTRVVQLNAFSLAEMDDIMRQHKA
jgi:hypothetical protein